MAGFADDVALLQARLAANAPQFARNTTSATMGLLLSGLSHASDTQYLINSTQAQQYLATATGTFLDQRAADFGVFRSPGSPSSASVVFKVPSGTAPVTYTIPAGTLIGTSGDGITSIAQQFTTQAIATISSGGTVSNVMTVVNTTVGAAGNVAQGTINVWNAPIAGLVVSNATGDGGTAATGGADADTDAQLRAKALAAVASKYGAAQITATILAVPGAFDAYVNDPQDGTGTITYKWADINRAQVLATSGAVSAAVGPVLPPNITATGGTFTVHNVTAISVKYDAPTAVKNTTALNNAVKAAVAAYLQSLVHNTVPLVAPMFQYVQNYSSVGGVLTNFVILSSTPDIVSVLPTASNNDLWGCSGGSGVVTVSVF